MNILNSASARPTWLDERLEPRDLSRDRPEQALLALASLFVTVNAVAYSLVSTGGLAVQHLWPPAVWLVLFVAAHILLRSFRPRRDPFLLPVIALLTGWGLLLIDRLADNFLNRQVIWLAFAIGVALAVAILPASLSALQRYRMILLVGGLALLGLTLIFGVNPSGAGAALWLRLPLPLVGAVYFQPSELLKPLFAIFFASYFAERVPFRAHDAPVTEPPPVGLRSLPFLGPLLLMGGFSLLLLVWQRDLGAAALFFLLFLALLYLATGRLAYVVAGLLMLVAGGLFGYVAFGNLVALRIDAWLNPWPDASDRAYQIVQSLYAFAAGGVTGQGIGQGYPGYIPVVHSDFAFAAIGEEWGLIGALSILGCFMLLAQRALRAAVLSTNRLRPRPFHTYLAAGIAVLFSVQAILIMAGVTKLLPLTGITLPFVSYGGSSLVVSGLMAGLLFFLTDDANTPA